MAGGAGVGAASSAGESTEGKADQGSWLSSRTQSIWLLQLVLAASVVVTVVVVLALHPTLFAQWTFAVGVASIICLTAAALIVPWHRVPRDLIILLPFGDLLGIGFLAFNSEMRLSYFWVFPIIWIATHFSMPLLVGALGTAGVIMLIDATVNFSVFSTLRMVVVLLALTFIALTTFLTARQNKAFKQLLRRQASRLQGTLQRVSGQERRVSQMLNGLDTGIARLSSHGEVLALNDTYVSLYAIDRDDPQRPGGSVEYAALRGDPLPESDRPFVRAARGEQFHDERVWLFDTRGQWHALSASTRRLHSSDGEPSTTLLIVHDVTALIEAERAREQIATVVSHELRNPLTAIIGHADLLLDRDDLPPRVREQIEVIENAGGRMQTLISEILAGSRARFDEPVTRARLDARRILDASVQSFRPAAEARRITVVLNAPENLPLVGDAFRLRQAFDNLLSNAIKYTSGGGTVRIAARQSAERLTVAFTDTGVGISPEDLPHIFDPYFRTQSARESATPGTGLGMGIVRDIVEQHGGSLGVESEQRTGTTVTVDLPSDTGA